MFYIFVPASMLVKRLCVNAFIVLFLGAIACDTIPTMCTAHQRMKDSLDPLLDATGLWQGTWQLYAPEPDSVNARISATIEFDDGAQIVWRSVNWPDVSAWNRFVQFRRMEFCDNLRLDDNSAAWDSFARYLGHSVRAPSTSDARPVRVTLHRHWSVVPPPEAQSTLLPVGGTWHDGQQASFYRKEW